MKPAAFLGLRTVVYQVVDLAKAKAWYVAALGIEPYFDQPFYVGFNVGGFELGLHPNTTAPAAGPGDAVAYWGVESMASAWPRLIGLGGVPVGQPQDVGEGIQVATLKDPFGNHVGIIENPHFPNPA